MLAWISPPRVHSTWRMVTYSQIFWMTKHRICETTYPNLMALWQIVSLDLHFEIVSSNCPKCLIAPQQLNWDSQLVFAVEVFLKESDSFSRCWDSFPALPSYYHKLFRLVFPHRFDCLLGWWVLVIFLCAWMKNQIHYLEIYQSRSLSSNLLESDEICFEILIDRQTTLSVLA